MAHYHAKAYPEHAEAGRADAIKKGVFEECSYPGHVGTEWDERNVFI